MCCYWILEDPWKTLRMNWSHVIFICPLFLPWRGNQYLMYIYSVMPCMYYFALCSSIWQQWRSTLGHWSMFFFFLPCRCTITQKRITVIHIDLHVPHTSAMRGWARGLNVKNVFCLAEKKKKVCWSSRASCCGFRSIWKESADGTIRTRCFDLQL